MSDQPITPSRRGRSTKSPGGGCGSTALALEPTRPLSTARPNVLLRVELAVRWRDLDAFNHVNNSNFLTYLEEARLIWLQGLPGPWLSETCAPVLAAATVNYRRPIGWPETVSIELYCERLGSSSLTLAHRIVSTSDPSVLYSDGSVVMVWVDSHSGKAAALPEAVRTAASR